MEKQIYSKNGKKKIKKTRVSFNNLFFAPFVQQQNDNFITSPEMKIDTRKSRKRISRNAKNQ